jgi:hypothetical protein
MHLQDSIDLADELHPDGQGALRDGAAELYKSESSNIYKRSLYDD